MRRIAFATVCVLAGCARASAPEGTARVAATPAPALQGSSSGAATRSASADTARQDQASSLTAAALDQRTADLFGASLRLESALRVPMDSNTPGGGDDEPSWDLDVRSYETFDRVRHYVRVFTGSSRGHFADRLSAGTRFEPMIREKLRAGSLPEDMYYLALIESGFNPHAYSRAAAVGMWQFMTTTARGFGLRIDWWVDERRDPVRSTDAAVRFLRGLNDQFGSMYLAAAAYNGGPGRIARGLNRYADDFEGTSADSMFFVLADKKVLRGETSNYVPQLIAAALVAKEAERHGIFIERREPFAYDSVWVRGRVPLKLIADAAGTNVAEIQELNPHILRGMTYPLTKGDSAKIRIPVGTAPRFDSAFAEIPADSLAAVKVITSEKGATWASIARKHKVSARAVSTYNPKVKASRNTGQLPTGSSIIVPVPSVVAAALAIPDPAIERYGVGTRTHVVRPGENLSVIAKRYRTTAAAIMRLNRLQKPMIFPGQELLVNGAPAQARKPTKKATASRR